MSLNLDFEDLGKKMIAAARTSIGESKWPTTRNYFETESQAYLSRLATIVKLKNDGLISNDRAQQHMELQRNSWETVLLAVEGLTQLLVEQAINAAIKVVRDAINDAIGFVLL